MNSMSSSLKSKTFLGLEFPTYSHTHNTKALGMPRTLTKPHRVGSRGLRLDSQNRLHSLRRPTVPERSNSDPPNGF